MISLIYQYTLPVDFKTRKGNERIREDPEIKKVMIGEEVEEKPKEGTGKSQAEETETIDLTGEEDAPTFRTPEEREEMMMGEVKTKDCKIKVTNIRSMSECIKTCIMCSPASLEEEYDEHIEIEHNIKDKARRRELMGQSMRKENAKKSQVKPQEKRKVRETDAEERDAARKQEPPAKVVWDSKTPDNKRRRGPSGSTGPAESPKSKKGATLVSEATDEWTEESRKDKNYSSRLSGGEWNIRRLTKSLERSRQSAPEQRETMSERGHAAGAQNHKTAREMMGRVPNQKTYWARAVFTSFENGKLPDEATVNTGMGLLAVKAAGISALEMKSKNVKQKGRAFLVIGQEGMQGLLGKKRLEKVEIVRVEMGEEGTPWKMTPETIDADGEIRAAIKAGDGIYLAGSVKIDCPGPELCTQRKCRTGDPMIRGHDNVHDDMNMYVIMHDQCLFIAMINIFHT